MNEPVVRNPELRDLVELARSQRAPEVRVTVEDVWRRAEIERRRSRSWIVVGATALAAGLVAWLAFTSPRELDRSRTDEVPTQAADEVVQRTTPLPAVPSRERATANDDAARPEAVPEVTEVIEPEPQPEPAVALAEGVVFEPMNGAAPATVLSSWRVAVAAGRYRVETPADGSVLEIMVGPRVTRIEPGSKLTFDASQTSTRNDTAEPTAAELAQQAEHAMAQGRRSEAIELLTKLVRKHPRSPQARAGLIDLARLHKAEGAWDRARCAYQLYLDRFPGASLRPEVERALYKLGEGKPCKGLTPTF